MSRNLLAKMRFTRLEHGVVAHGEASVYDDRTVVVQSQSLPSRREEDLPFGVPIPLTEFEALYARGNFLFVLPTPLGTYSVHCESGQYDPEEANCFLAALRT